MSVYSLFLILLGFTNISLAEKGDDQPTKTSMNEVTTLLELKKCKLVLDALALELIGAKKHRILSYSSKGDAALFNAIMVLEYHDRVAHVNFSASLDSSGVCQANYTSTFVVNEPCAVVREEVIKRFLPKGKLSNKTWVFEHKRKPNLVAMTSPVNRGRHCLVTHKTK